MPGLEGAVSVALSSLARRLVPKEVLSAATLCLTESRLVTVIVSPALTVIVAGEKAKPLISIALVVDVFAWEGVGV